MQGIEFLDRARVGSVDVSGEDIVVVGGGNTAIDAARSAFRLGAENVRIIYRRTRDEMPAIPEEVDDAIDEGIQIDFLCAPARISGDGEKRRLSCLRMELGDPDESGRRRPVVIPGSDFEIPCDRVILAVGQAADLSLLPEDAELSKDHADRARTWMHRFIRRRPAHQRGHGDCRHRLRPGHGADAARTIQRRNAVHTTRPDE